MKALIMRRHRITRVGPGLWIRRIGKQPPGRRPQPAPLSVYLARGALIGLFVLVACSVLGWNS